MQRLRLITVALLSISFTGACTGVPTVLVVNMIPLQQSAEANDNAEPTVAVKQPFPLHIAATAHLPGGTFCGAADRSAIFVSDDGGLTWSLRCIVERDPASFPADPILRFLNDDLYAAYLYKADWAALTTTVRLAKASQFLTDPVMTAPFTDWIDFDQPHLHTWAGSIAGGVGIAASDFSTVFETPITCHAGVVVAAVPPTGPWRRKCIAVRSGYGRHDGARVTTHGDGTTYAAYQRVVDFPASCIPSFRAMKVTLSYCGGIRSICRQTRSHNSSKRLHLVLSLDAPSEAIPALARDPHDAASFLTTTRSTLTSARSCVPTLE